MSYYIDTDSVLRKMPPPVKRAIARLYSKYLRLEDRNASERRCVYAWLRYIRLQNFYDAGKDFDYETLHQTPIIPNDVGTEDSDPTVVPLLPLPPPRSGVA